MDNWFIAILLSIVEGLTEFLPISSSGHLILISELLNFTGEKAVTFNIVIQLGAVLAIVVLYWSKFCDLLRPKPHIKFSGLYGIYLLILTSIPACCVGLLAHSYIKKYLFTPETVFIALIFGALCMVFVEKRTEQARYTTLNDMTPKLAFGIGCFQCFALWPGFSRSASTIMGGMLLGVSRKLAAEYSFIAAVPIMFAATSYDLFKSWQLLSVDDILFFTLGFIGSFLAALAAVKFFVSLISHVTLIPFAIYRLVLAVCMYLFMLG